jgi:hypothetical protein
MKTITHADIDLINHTLTVHKDIHESGKLTFDDKGQAVVDDKNAEDLVKSGFLIVKSKDSKGKAPTKQVQQNAELGLTEE